MEEGTKERAKLVLGTFRLAPKYAKHTNIAYHYVERHVLLAAAPQSPSI